MKYFILSLIALLIIPSYNSDFGDFVRFAVKNFDPPETVARKCDWQYAIIKLQVNKENKVVSFETLNEVSHDFNESLSFLKSYKFDSKLHINQRPILFCLSIVNLRWENCDSVGPNNRKFLKGVDKLKAYQSKHMQDEKNSIFIYKEFTKQIFDYEK
jgi:hypothetical protein